MKEQNCGHGPKSNLLAYCDEYNSIITVKEKLSVNFMKFRKIRAYFVDAQLNDDQMLGVPVLRNFVDAHYR